MQTTLELLDDTYTIFTKSNNDSLDNSFMMNLENLINGNKGKVQGNLFRGIDNKTNYRRSPHFMIFGTKMESRNVKFTNCGTPFQYKTPNWVQNFSKVHFLSFVSYNYGVFFHRNNIFRSSVTCFLNFLSLIVILEWKIAVFRLIGWLTPSNALLLFDTTEHKAIDCLVFCR